MEKHKHERSTFSGKIGFVLSAAGASVGLGNIWRFPYLAAKYGGGIFLLIYIILALTFGYSMIVAETALGRMTRKSPVGAFGKFGKSKWLSFGGWINAIIPVLIVPYYSVIGGWVIKYLIEYIKGNSQKLAEDGYFSDKTINEIVRASFEMGAVKTGALIVIEEETILNEYARTGIYLDSLVSSQLLINIFEHNTPLHDGAIVIRGDRIVAATCYLPLSDNMALNKNLGTRHRAGVGISEVSDSFTIIVSEETGNVSVAKQGKLDVALTKDELKERLKKEQNATPENAKRKKIIWKGWGKNEKKSDE